MKTILCVALLSACAVDHPDYPDNPSSGSGGSSGHFYKQVTGKVCLLTDTRRLDSCATTGALGVTIESGLGSAAAKDDGSFTITVDTSVGDAWRLSGPSIVTSVIEHSDGATLPAVTAADYQALLAANGVTIAAGHGSVFAYLTAAGDPLPKAVASGAFTSLYDGATAAAWRGDATGALGAAWLPDLVAGDDLVTISPLGKPPFIIHVAVAEQSITFVTVETN